MSDKKTITFDFDELEEFLEEYSKLTLDNDGTLLNSEDDETIEGKVSEEKTGLEQFIEKFGNEIHPEIKRYFDKTYKQQ